MSTGAPGVMLSAKDLSFTIGGATILEDFEIDLPSGRVVGLIGPNGAGKTTALDLLSGFRERTAGSVQLGEHELAGKAPDYRARMGLARTFQESPVVAGLNVQEHVDLALEAAGRHRASKSSALTLLQELGLEEDAASPAELLPIGKRRLLDVARALATVPDVLLLDEPFAGLEPSEEARLNRRIRDLKGDGRAVLIVEHRLGLLGDIADSVIVLVEGRILAEGPMEDVLQDESVRRAYLRAGEPEEGSEIGQ